ncbi:hypothetical protein GPECTOR_582g640 [Gonium pectorale]|uniref:Uncharacterized protein n=1 Tax=Gonium pectorale TaxID=33097 RepID=A0A150FW72_GONPE|nr:hypothetical protein GPECTOR_582g640 [Gonium pectorale]|eukprot:KXZ41280.1 hypothetical protein GPECTOR_582g640 [Gonium pectorale]
MWKPVRVFLVRNWVADEPLAKVVLPFEVYGMVYNMWFAYSELVSVVVDVIMSASTGQEYHDGVMTLTAESSLVSYIEFNAEYITLFGVPIDTKLRNTLFSLAVTLVGAGLSAFLAIVVKR